MRRANGACACGPSFRRCAPCPRILPHGAGAPRDRLCSAPVTPRGNVPMRRLVFVDDSRHRSRLALRRARTDAACPRAARAIGGGDGRARPLARARQRRAHRLRLVPRPARRRRPVARSARAAQVSGRDRRAAHVRPQGQARARPGSAHIAVPVRGGRKPEPQPTAADRRRDARSSAHRATRRARRRDEARRRDDRGRQARRRVLARRRTAAASRARSRDASSGVGPLDQRRATRSAT